MTAGVVKYSGVFYAFYWMKVSHNLQLTVLFICDNPMCGIS